MNASLCNYSDTYILVEGRIIVVTQVTNDAAIAADRNNKEVVIKKFAPFTNCISKMNSAEVNNAEDLNIVMRMYILLEHGNNYANTTSLWQYYRDEPNDDDITDPKSFKFKSMKYHR